ncbi:hypothetical protein ACFQQB_09600 [Nonomuraea rubra]|uniref:hypothetical protein n=1 Tax=Nonomuraea rubra TaxID=46180 RepID=UPI003619D2D1
MLSYRSPMGIRATVPPSVNSMGSSASNLIPALFSSPRNSGEKVAFALPSLDR